jgi:hypothetical protein
MDMFVTGGSKRGRPPKHLAPASSSPPRRVHRTASPEVVFSRTNRAKVTNDPAFLPRAASGWRAQTRRRRDLVATFLAALGGINAVSDLALIAVKRAAELTAAAEITRAAVLNGGNNAATLDALIKLEGEARRSVRALGLKLDAAKPHVPMREQLAAELDGVDEADEAEPPE